MSSDRMPYEPVMMPQTMGYHSSWGSAAWGGVETEQGTSPIVEPTIEKCIKRDFCHEVPHVCPVHTKIINNHIFHHTYVPHYTCSEENIVSNVGMGSCCKFM